MFQDEILANICQSYPDLCRPLLSVLSGAYELDKPDVWMSAAICHKWQMALSLATDGIAIWPSRETNMNRVFVIPYSHAP